MCTSNVPDYLETWILFREGRTRKETWAPQSGNLFVESSSMCGTWSMLRFLTELLWLFFSLCQGVLHGRPIVWIVATNSDANNKILPLNWKNFRFLEFFPSFITLKIKALLFNIFFFFLIWNYIAIYDYSYINFLELRNNKFCIVLIIFLWNNIIRLKKIFIF